MEFSDDRRCLVCGAKITDNNPDGIGFGCRALLPQAMNLIISSDEEHKFDMRNIKISVWMNEFQNYCSSKKFRSQFKKDFSSSVIKQYNENGRLSNKQFDIVKNMLCSQDLYSGNSINGETATEIRLNHKTQELCHKWKEEYFNNPKKKDAILPMMITLWKQNGSKQEV